MEKISNKKRIPNYLLNRYEKNVAIKNTIVRQEMGQHNLIHSNHKISVFLIGIK